ncbi:hypothetical protein V7O66_04385 [Methanolobus sp. ZRKC3]|uniref:DUF7544 domain-containing protein n=1 Tax=Methanolobus sp. ZRKC3 TaxID=3125786 RepID=UPI0032450F7B
MSWYVIDAVDRAFDRTKKCLLEPFDFWKWLKLAIIVMLIGGGGSSFNGGGNNYSASDSDVSGASDFFHEMFGGISFPDFSEPSMALIIAAAILFILLILVFAYISNVMEFVLVESLVSNDVRFWEYSRRYLGKGLNLFLFRFIIGLIILIPIILVTVPLAFIAFADTSTQPTFTSMMALLLILIPLILLLVILSAIIQSFVNLSIPVSIYTEMGIFASFKTILRRFKADWQQILIYWLGRIVLAIAVGILVAIVAIIAIVLLALLALIIDGIIYFVLAAILRETVVWIILAPLLFVQLLIFILLMMLISMPARVFMKYHMLSFLEQWYPESHIPIFDIMYHTEDTSEHMQI